MSEILTALKKEVLLARKSGDKAKSGVGLVLIGDVETETKRTGEAVTDVDMVSRIKKLIDANQEVLENTSDAAKIDVLKREIAFLETFMPSQMSEDELRTAISKSGLDNIGAIMGYLKRTYPGQFDGGLASKLIREALA